MSTLTSNCGAVDKKSSHSAERRPDFRRDLFITEKFWRDLQPYLATKGYMLRPRYMPNWTPSWKDGDFVLDFEDSTVNLRSPIMDATRISDGELVILKRVFPSDHPQEVEMTQYFSTEPARSHPHNHCVPLLDTFEVPDYSDSQRLEILVLPCLREFNDPPMRTIGEAVEFFRQIFEGLQFMHSLHIAHRDAMVLNIMMDPKPMYPNMFHPVKKFLNRNFKGKAKHYTRTARPTKYYFIDFGLSCRYDPENGPSRDIPIFGGDKSVPEFIDNPDQPHNPFPTDIYYVGNVIRDRFLNKTHGLEFMSSLVNDMTQDDPSRVQKSTKSLVVLLNTPRTSLVDTAISSCLFG
ncbi:hypothetical protein C8Q75DRAFT_808159 [Abortiporus biennis]|nr:hypothetical protein C8Q75DRAFT_808159 [Abortiporus biennis]